MAVYTRLTDEQIASISDAIGVRISGIEEITSGTNDSKYRASLEGSGEQLLITIHETLDVNPTNGMSAEDAGVVIELLKHISDKMKQSPYDHSGDERAIFALNRILNQEVADGNLKQESLAGLFELYPIAPYPSSLKDQNDQYVNALIPEPLMWQTDEGEKPYGVMEFPGAGMHNVNKAISIIPFYQNAKQIPFEEGVSTSPEQAYMGGRMLAAFHLLAADFPEVAKLHDHFDPHTFKQRVDLLQNEKMHPNAKARIGDAALTENDMMTPSGFAAEVMGENILSRLSKNIDYITSLWASKTQGLKRGVLHGDFYPDNHLTTAGGAKAVLDPGAISNGVRGVDIGLALNAWAGDNTESREAFLKGYDEVKPISQKLNDALPFMQAVGATYIALMRAFKIVNPQQGQNVNLRSPIGEIERAAALIEADEETLNPAEKKLLEAARDKGHQRG